MILVCVLTAENHIMERTSSLRSSVNIVEDTISELIEGGHLQEDGANSMIIIFNTISQLSDAMDADIFVCAADGKIILCKDFLKNNLDVSEYHACVHKDMKVPFENIKRSIDAPGNNGYNESFGTLDGFYEKVHVVVSKPIRAGDKLVGIVYATEPTWKSIFGHYSSIVGIFVTVFIIAFLLVVACVYIVVYKLTKPLSSMVKITKSYAHGDFSKRIETDRDDELGELITSFNAMASSLSILESSRRSFVANVSHELKTPMTIIGGFIDGVLDGTIPPEKQTYYLKIVSSEIQRLSRLVVSMLNLSKIEAGQINLNITNFNLSKQIIETLLTFEKRIEEKRIEITGLECLEDVFLNADEDMINQVVYNLIENAVKFTPEEGEINFLVEEDEDNVTVAIKNTGSGISSEQLPRIFERFYKVDTSRSYDVKGAGLGLYLVKTFLELHKGSIEVSSIEGKYTQFKFNIPKN